MSGRSFLCDFCQTLRHKNYIYIPIYLYNIWCICQNLCSVKRKFQCPISQLIKKIFAWNFEGGLIDHQSCFTKNLKFLVVRELVFLKSEFGQNRRLTLFYIYIYVYIYIYMYYRPSKCFLYFTWIWFRGYVGLFFRCIWSPYRLASLLIYYIYTVSIYCYFSVIAIRRIIVQYLDTATFHE